MARVLFIRHAQSEGNENSNLYMKDGDYPLGITKKGWKQALACGRFLQGYMMGTNTKDWPLVFVSSYTRTKETLSGILHGMKGHLQPPEGPALREDPRLTERFAVASIGLKKNQTPLDWRIAEQLWKLSQNLYSRDPFAAGNLLGDSRKDTYVAVAGFIEGPLKQALDAGQSDILIVSHGVAGQEFTRAILGLPMMAEIPELGNCDILEFTGSPGNWQLRKLYDGPAMAPSGEAFTGHLKPLSLADLPPVPDEFC